MYFFDTRRVPLALGMSPLAFKEERIVKPIDLPCLKSLRYFLSRFVAL